MDIQYLLKHERIPLWNLWESSQEYFNNFKHCNISENHIESIMHLLQNQCPDIVFLWWQTVRNFSMWYRQMRLASCDIDTIWLHENTIVNLNELAKNTRSKFVYNQVHNYFYLVLNWNPISISPKNIYWIVISEQEIWNFNWIRMIKPEILSCLKLRRKRKWETRNKDIVDISSLILSSLSWKINFNLQEHESFTNKIWNDYCIKSADIKNKLLSCMTHKTIEREEIEIFLEKKT